MKHPCVIALLPLCLAWSAARGAAAEAPAPAHLRFITQISPTTNLIHWVDNLAGTSQGKTMPVYRRYWESRFGPHDEEDRRALRTFANIRRLAPPMVKLPAVAPGNASGCLPVPEEVTSWHQAFMEAAMSSTTLEEFRAAIAKHLPAEETEALMGALARFNDRFQRAFDDLGHARSFQKRFQRFLEHGQLIEYLDSVARFLGVDPAVLPPMRISYIVLPEDGSTHAEADGDHLLVEIRPHDRPDSQIQVVSHEASHFLMRRMSAAQLDTIARQVYAEGEAGALVWRYMWEGLPTALGQGLAEARLAPKLFSLQHPWYHRQVIDRFAKLIYPALAQAVDSGKRIEDGLMPLITREVAASPLYSEARPGEFMMTAFFAGGAGLAGTVDMLRMRLGLRHDGSEPTQSLEDPAFADLLDRYECLGGMLLVSDTELRKAAVLDGEQLLPAGVVAEMEQQAARGAALIAAGRRKAGGSVLYLVAPSVRVMPALIDTLTKLRGLPDRPLAVGGMGLPPSELSSPPRR